MDQEAKNRADHAATKAVTFSAVKPQLFVDAPKASDAVQFYKAAFGAEEVSRSLNPKRKADEETPLVLAAEIKLGGFTLVVSDAASDESSDPLKSGGSGFSLCLETEDVEAAVKQAVAAGGVSEGEVAAGEEACCGGKSVKVKDPYGFAWVICSAAVKKDPEVAAAKEHKKIEVDIVAVKKDPEVAAGEEHKKIEVDIVMVSQFAPF